MRRVVAVSGKRTGENPERGAVGVLVALLMVVMLGFGAIAVDVGMLYAERTQVRNGSDAAALLIAQKCARNVSDVDCSTTSPLARSFADQNANDGLGNIRSTALDKAARAVTVTASAKQAGEGPNQVSLLFARALGFNSAEVNASSKAVWGSAVAGRTAFPLAFSVCQVKDKIDGELQRLQDHGKNANADCNYGPSGAAVEGGFGWLVQDAGKCGGSIDLALSEGGSDPGNNAPGNCSATLNKWGSEITAGRKVTVLLPIFNKVTGTGNGAVYSLVAFAAFEITGWKFSGDTALPNTFQNSAGSAPGVTSANECRGECRGIIGKFVKYTSLDDGYTLGPVDEYGATIVRMGL